MIWFTQNFGNNKSKQVSLCVCVCVEDLKQFYTHAAFPSTYSCCWFSHWLVQYTLESDAVMLQADGKTLMKHTGLL